MVKPHPTEVVVNDFLANRIDLDAFEDWSALNLQYARRFGNAGDRRLADSIRAILNAFADDDTEDGMRMELQSVLSPSHFEASLSVRIPGVKRQQARGVAPHDIAFAEFGGTRKGMASANQSTLSPQPLLVSALP